MTLNPGSASDLIIVVNSILSVTSIASVGIRFQRPNNPRGGIDMQNVMLCTATLCGVTSSIIQCVAASKYGLGSQDTTETFLKLYPVLMIFYFLCNMFVKFGLLIFYLRTTYERIHVYAIWFMLFVSFGFGVSNVFVMAFQCLPLAKLWDPTLPGTCVNILPFYYANTYIMIAIDSIMYVMPMIFTWNLALRRPQRIVLNLLFALGSIVVLVSILRLLALIRFDREGGQHFAYHIASVLVWSAIENHTAIFIACSPSIKALVIGTLVPLVSSAGSSVNEKVRALRSSQGSTQGGRPNSDSNQYAVGNIQHQLALKVLRQAPVQRQSMDSDNSQFDLTATRDYRMNSSTSSEPDIYSLNRKGSESSMDKGATVTVTPLGDLEAQTLPAYTYDPKQTAQK